jgi:hypothetical protein
MPGQLWFWNFDLGESTWWPAQRVSEAARDTFMVNEIEYLHLGDTFVMVSVDDPGPFEFKLPDFNEDGTLRPEQTPRRWHVILLHGSLVWLDHAWLDDCGLIE